MRMIARRADPYRDVLVIDARAPRLNQTVVATGAVVALLTGAWPIVLVLGVQLAVSVVFGRQYCLPCLFYFEVVQPRRGEGPLEDARAPRFANSIGAVFLLSAGVLWGAGFVVAGEVLSGVVAVLAGMAALSGLCVGCELYKWLARVRGIRGKVIDAVDLGALGIASESEYLVLFTHPLCSECHSTREALRVSSTPVVEVDVSRRKDLAKKYGISVVPLVMRVDGSGRVK